MNPNLFHPQLLIGRRALLSAVIAAAGSAKAAQPCALPVVLFVCPAGTVKSAIARDSLRREAGKAGVAVSVISRGIHPEDHVSPGLRAKLVADGMNPGSEPALPINAGDIRRASITIVFDEAAAAPGLERARVWDIPSWNGDYSGAKTALATRVDDLVEELRAARPCRG